MEITVPEGWHDVTVNQYQALKELNREDYKSDLSYTNVVLQILCEIPTAEPFTLDVLAKIAPHIHFIHKLPSQKKLKSFTHNEVNYKWIGDFGKLTVGEAISIEQIIDLEELTFDQSFDVILAVLLRKDNELFSSESFVKNRSEYGNLPISKVMGMLLFFLNGGTISTSNMEDYLIVTATSKKIIQKKSGRLKRLLQKLRKAQPFTNGYQWLTRSVKVILRMIKQLTK